MKIAIEYNTGTLSAIITVDGVDVYTLMHYKGRWEFQPPNMSCPLMMGENRKDWQTALAKSLRALEKMRSAP